MKVSYNWLKEYVNFDYTPAELAEKLTMAGIEVEELIATVPKFSGVYVAKVESVRKHPNADKLSLCDVNTGDSVTEVVCGAPNVAAGQLIPFAPVGTVLPNGITIKKAKIRGVESVGMICSQEELGLADHSDGIWALEGDWSIGQDVYETLKKNEDFILDLSITPNRPDAMSMTGIAREVAAIADTSFHYPEIDLKENNQDVAESISVEIQVPEGCPRYAARIIKNVKIQPSPEWLSNKLESAGIRSINNIVDVTNFVLMELGQPLHAFDLNTIEDQKIVVRASGPGEKFITLDDKERSLPDNTVMICDGRRPVAIGGIMGGQNSEVSDQTTDILLESAYFTPVYISASAKKLGLFSEASQRFERGIDPNGVIRAIDRAAALMAELGEGTVLKGIVDNYPAKIEDRKVTIRPERVNLVLGTDLSEAAISGILKRLGITYQAKMATVPTFRPDLEREIDLIEEVARMINFDSIPVKEDTSVLYDTAPNPHDIFNDRVKSQLREFGFCEVLTNSMVAARELEAIGDQSPVKIMNPISDDMNALRTSILPGLLRVTAYNINRNNSDLRLYEVGRVFYKTDKIDLDSQPQNLAGVMHGTRQQAAWEGKSLPVDFYDVKGLIEAFFTKISLDNIEFILYDNNIYFEPDMVVAIKAAGELIGHFGRINRRICSLMDVDSPVYGFELTIPALRKAAGGLKMFSQISKYPFVEKDVAFLIDRSVPAGEVSKVILQTGQPLVSQVDIFDLYQGKQLAEDKKSVAFRIRFQSLERTLEDKEVSQLFTKIINFVKNKYSATLREV